METMEKRLYDETFAMKRSVDVCVGEVAQIEDKIAKHEDKAEETLIDDAIQPPTPLYKQLSVGSSKVKQPPTPNKTLNSCYLFILL